MTLKEAMNLAQKDIWIKALQSEFESLIENDTWTLVDRLVGKSVIACYFVFRIKINIDTYELPELLL